MHQLIRKIEDQIESSEDGKILVTDIVLKFVSEMDGKTKAEYHTETGDIKREEKEWTILFETDGELHAFPIEYAYEAEEAEGVVTLHYDYEDDEYLIVQFRFGAK